MEELEGNDEAEDDLVLAEQEDASDAASLDELAGEQPASPDEEDQQ